MIPKIIHYCWFGGNPIPEKDKRCIESWKKLCPDYVIIRWDESNYDITKIQFIKEAYQAKKWGFVSDYARLDIVYEYGGIYFDTDVELLKNLDNLLTNKAFMGFEAGKLVSPGLCMAAEKHHYALKELMDIYKELSFFNHDGSYNMIPIPNINTDYLLKHGLIQNDQKQLVADITIYPTEYFCPKDFFSGKLNVTDQTYSIHWFNASWHSPRQKFLLKIGRIIGPDLYFKLIDIKNFLSGKPKRVK